MKTVRILTLDGGGVRGIIPATILMHLEERTGRPVCELFDLIAGTSIGGILALAVTRPSSRDNLQPMYSVAELREIIVRSAAALFESSSLLWVLYKRSKYDPKTFSRFLAQMFDSTKFGDAIRPVLITSYDVLEKTPRVFTSWNRDDKSLLMADLARATSSVPFYFTPHHLQDDIRELLLIDGAFFADNPSLAAYTEALSLFGVDETPSFCFVSIGTGRSVKQESYTDQMLEKIYWGDVRQSLDRVVDASRDYTHQQIAKLLHRNHRYYRLQPSIADLEVPIDSSDKPTLKALIDVAGEYLHDHAREMDELCERLLVDQ